MDHIDLSADNDQPGGAPAPQTAAGELSREAAILASLIPDEPRSRSRVVSALMRGLVAERRLPS